MILTPKNWNSFQHYKDRAPSWIKLHKGLLDDFDFCCLPVASRALAPFLWLLASEYDDGKITASLDALAFRLRMTRGELADALSPLIESGFFHASEPLAECKQPASPEKEEEEENIEKRERKNGAHAPIDPSAPEREFFERGKEVLGRSSGGQLAKLLRAKGSNVALARACLETASQKQNPSEYIAGAIRGPPAVRAATVYQQRQAEGREILDEIDQSISRRSGAEDFIALRHDPGDGRPPVRGGPGPALIDIPAKSNRSCG